ncbi:MAG: phosphoribosylformimino-5-aminoimidazole carboxamide ribotide isomerase [Lachnospiraceae bacterium]|nr:phosphoribosylformimino-5-aminoimidazole carboxamide ribotide isomerase [Lachnospiraceae bacterium]
MQFRPCIDIHNGKVKQIVGGSLKDEKDQALENFVSERSAADFARLYASYHLKGGHVVLLNAGDSEYYEATKTQALEALHAYPGGLQVGGGVNPSNAVEFLDAGASHVIVTSYVFSQGQVQMDKLKEISSAVGRERLVLDLSCKKIGGDYRIVTDRWQNVTETILNEEALDMLAEYCDEFLVHAVDVEGKASGIEEAMVALLGNWGKKPVTYAGGVHDYLDLDQIKKAGRGKVDVTIGSALDIFGGKMEFEKVILLSNSKETAIKTTISF